MTTKDIGSVTEPVLLRLRGKLVEDGFALSVVRLLVGEHIPPGSTAFSMTVWIEPCTLVDAGPSHASCTRGADVSALSP